MIEHLKSGLSVSTHVGCTMSCSYCVLSSFNDFRNGPQKNALPQNIVDSLLSGEELFLNGQTPLIINNRTDPMLPEVKNVTYTLLTELTRAGITSPVLVISKFPPTASLTHYFDQLPLMYIYSYSNLPVDFNFQLVDAHLKQIQQYVPPESRFHYFRPIIPGKNDSPVQMLACIKKFQKANFRGTVMTGLRITDNNRGLVDDINSYDPQHKLLQQGLYPEILNRMIEEGITYSVFRHTACAIATFLGAPCKLGYFHRDGHCNPKCINLSHCGSKKCPKIEQILLELYAKFGPDFQAEFLDASVLTVYSEINQEQVAFIKNAYGLGVEAHRIALSPSERSILGYE